MRRSAEGKCDECFWIHSKLIELWMDGLIRPYGNMNKRPRLRVFKEVCGRNGVQSYLCVAVAVFQNRPLST